MKVEYKIVESDMEISNYGQSEVHISKRIYFIIIVDDIEQEVDLPWLKVLLASKKPELDKLESEISNYKSKLNNDILDYTIKNHFNIKKSYIFDYDSNICIDYVCSKQKERKEK